jgi:GT2 family glycosyltransferase
VSHQLDSGTTDLSLPRVSVVVLAWKSEPYLQSAVRAALASQDVDADVILVDNGCTDGDVGELAGVDGVTVVTPPGNLGFAGGATVGWQLPRVSSSV